MGQGHREDFYEVKEQRFLGGEAFVDSGHRQLHGQAPLVYDISLGKIASEVSSALQLPTDLLYTLMRNRQGALGRAVTGYVGRKLGGYQIKASAEHFHRDPVVISQGIRRLENRIKEEKGFVETVSDIEQSLIQKSRRKIPI
jgi:chromosomal replication initiation ATPase DnaA